MDSFYAVIMAGGGGTRLWPLSRKQRPKQSLRLLDSHTLFQMAVDRLLPLIPAERIMVVTVKDQVDQLRLQENDIPLSNFVVEPSGKGTASVVGLAALELKKRDPDAVMAVLTADHVIEDVAAFRTVLGHSYHIAQQGELVTLGITPTYAATGYGYIQRGRQEQTGQGIVYYEISSFNEKPDLELAEEYLASGNYYWNSGMFIWQAERILQEIDKHLPDLAAGIQRIRSASDPETRVQTLNEVWAGLVPETIDYGIMEKAERAVVLPADQLGWFDVGGWAGMYELFPEDENQNILHAEDTVILDTTSSLIYQDQGPQGRLIALLGAHDLIVVDTADALLICPRDRAEDVRKIVAILSKYREGKFI